MELRKTELYDAFGEFLYAIAMVDGEVQEAEVKKIEELLTNHEGGEEIQWSFKYEKQKGKSVEEAFKKAIDICKYYGPSPDYPFLIETVRKVAEASNGLDAQEKELIARLEKEITEFYDIDREE
ncbi:MAG: TerB family tellurite resistance protein [Aureispira sp.]|nr:TerB family tellurite resistance protein [Aureispira sp.]